MPHTYIGVFVNPNWDKAEADVRAAAQEHDCGDPSFDREPPNKLHARNEFDDVQTAHQKLGPLRGSIEQRGYRVFESKVEDD